MLKLIETTSPSSFTFKLAFGSSHFSAVYTFLNHHVDFIFVFFCFDCPKLIPAPLKNNYTQKFKTIISSSFRTYILYKNSKIHIKHIKP